MDYVAKIPWTMYPRQYIHFINQPKKQGLIPNKLRTSLYCHIEMFCLKCIFTRSFDCSQDYMDYSNLPNNHYSTFNFSRKCLQKNMLLSETTVFVLDVRPHCFIIFKNECQYVYSEGIIIR